MGVPTAIADRAKTRRDIKRSPDFEAYDRAERKKSGSSLFGVGSVAKRGV